MALMIILLPLVFSESFTCTVGHECTLQISQCSKGWIRIQYSNVSIFSYFENSTFSFLPNTSGKVSGYVSCEDDGKEYSISFHILHEKSITYTFLSEIEKYRKEISIGIGILLAIIFVAFLLVLGKRR